MKVIEFPEVVVEGKRLGRHVEHDPRSRAFSARMAPAAAPLRTLRHRRYGTIFDQGNLGSCTGNATAGACNTVPIHATGEKVLREADAVAIYKLGTTLDEFEGEYPPDDTGSSGLGAGKAAEQMGLISSYGWAFGVDEAMRALQVTSLIIGVWWTEQMDEITDEGFVRIGGQKRGGHELLLRGYVAARRPYVLGDNSWGMTWGPLGGKFKLFVDELAELLADDGDAMALYA